MQEIYANASSFIKKPTTLNRLVSEIDKLDWYSARQEGLGDLYEGLLQKNAEEKKSGAGQYFTPRPLIDAMVAVMQPKLGDVIQDPAAGTGGFLIAAQHWIREHEDPSLLDERQQKQFYERTFYGMEHVQDTHRLALMNLMLHGLDSRPNECGIWYGDTLSCDAEALPLATLILTNPPFGTKKGGGLPSRKDFTFSTSNKQFCFLQHIYRALRPGGRAAVVLPDNVLFAGNLFTIPVCSAASPEFSPTFQPLIAGSSSRSCSRRSFSNATPHSTPAGASLTRRPHAAEGSPGCGRASAPWMPPQPPPICSLSSWE